MVHIFVRKTGKTTSQQYQKKYRQRNKNKRSEVEESDSDELQKITKSEAEESNSKESDAEASDFNDLRSVEKRRKARAQYQQEYRKRQKIKKSEAEESHSGDPRRISLSKYKRTTDKQYSLLTHEMVKFRSENRSDKSIDAMIYWNSLTDKLNALGPPYRTVRQWKKVWLDFISFHSKRNFKSVPKFTKTIKTDSNIGCDIFRVELQEEGDATSTKDAEFMISEWQEYDQNSQSMYSTNSIHYVDEHSCPDIQSPQHLTPELPDSLNQHQSYDFCTYALPNLEDGTPQRSENQSSVPNHRPFPSLRQSNNRLLDQTLYTLQNQMENQTKFLEHLSQVSSTIADLMKSQVKAVEKQTEAIRRQALATEHHTLVMNSFIDIIREKIPKTNSRTPTTSSSKVSNRSS